jgi:glycerate kinase
VKIVIAPDSYKGSIYAPEAARAMREGVLRVVPDAETVLVPVADGGDGTLETLVETSGGTTRTATVTGPLGDPTEAQWGAMGDGKTAVIEMARTSGLALVPDDRRNPLTATTAGLGEVIREALNEGFRRFILGIGGSATNDAGAGMAQALGVLLLDTASRDLEAGGAALAGLDHIDMTGLDPRAADAEFMVACDVSNPLTGPEGASAVYGPQKGATPAQVAQLDAALGNFADIVSRDLSADVRDVPGSGAAGGLGGGIMAFLGGQLRPGIDIVLDTLRFDDKLNGADLVITGEGGMDFQTVYNKAPIGVARLAKARGIAVIGVSGSLGKEYTDVHDHGIDAVTSITSAPMDLDEATDRCSELIADATEQALRMMRAGAAVFGHA